MPATDRTPPRHRATAVLRGVGATLAVLLLALGVATALQPGIPPTEPSPQPSPTSPAPTTPAPTTPTPSAPAAPTPPPLPPELDPPLMTGSIRVGEHPVAIALDPAAGLGYTANRDGGDVSVVDLSTGVSITALAVPGRPSAIATGPAGVVYVADRDSARVHGIDVVTGKRVSAWKVGKRPTALALDTDRERLYVAVTDAVEVYDSATGKRLETIHVDAPADLAVNPETHEVWVLWGGLGGVGVYDPRTREWTATGFGVPGATGLDVDGVNHRLYLTGPGLPLEEWNLDTGGLRRLAATGAGTAVRVDPVSRIAYLVDPDGNAVLALSVA